jgi:hypothetical protein
VGVGVIAYNLKLDAKYGLTDKGIAFIESMITPME